MTISRLRIEDICIFNYIKHSILGKDFIEQVTGAALTYSAALGLYVPSYSGMEPPANSVGRGWVAFDENAGGVDTSVQQTSRVSVDATTYSVNYLLGGIKNPNTVPTSVSYYWHYVSIIDGWPGGDPPPLPLVAVEIDVSRRSGLQIGPGYISRRLGYLHVFATSNAERADLTEALMNALYIRSIPLVNYSQGDYLTYEGLYDNSFTRPPTTGCSTLYFDDVTVRNIDIPNDWSDLNKFRASISFTLTSYVE